MIVVLTKTVTSHEKELIHVYLKDRGFTVRDQHFGEDEIIGAFGKGIIDKKELALLAGVERVASTSKPYELASRETKNEDTIVSLGAVKIGGSRISVIAGPCAVESKEQIMETAARVRESGAVLLRGGAFKPRSSPYAFQGLGMKGLEYMKEAGEKQGMPIVTEVVSPEFLIEMNDLTDMFQIGARNMQNFELLKKVGALGKPVLLKRGASATIEEWLLSAEYLLASGTKDVVLCERGIRTFETYTRNTLDISAIPVIKKLSHLPVIVDPSHAVGIRAKVSPVALAAIAAGADGLTVEVHPNPDTALSDGPQSLYPEQFEKLMRDVEALAPVVEKELLRTPRPSFSLPGNSSEKSSCAEAADTIGFSGDSGAFAEQAIIRSFGEDTQRIALPSFSAIFDAVLDGTVRFGMIPVENSLTGSIHENYDLFVRYPDIAIVGEIKLRIVHCLIADEKADIDSIKIIRSHPQGFAQCKAFLDTHPEWQFESVNSTSSAVVSIVRDGATKVAAIASEAAAKIHGLHVIKTGIETNPLNYTRFVIISRKNGSDKALLDKAPLPPNLRDEKLNKASFIFNVKDETGALFECIKVLSEYRINLSKLESRPIHGQPWRYMFYADTILTANDSAFEETLAALKRECEDFRLLGMYHAAI